MIKLLPKITPKFTPQLAKLFVERKLKLAETQILCQIKMKDINKNCYLEMTQLNLYDATRSRTHPPRLQIQRSTSELQELVRHKNNLKHSVYLTPHEHIVNICEGMCSQSSDT